MSVLGWQNMYLDLQWQQAEVLKSCKKRQAEKIKSREMKDDVG